MAYVRHCSAEHLLGLSEVAVSGCRFYWPDSETDAPGI